MDGELQIQMKNGRGLPQRTTVVNFRWRTTALGYKRRTRVAGFKWRTLAISGLLQVNTYSDWLQMENSGGFPQRTTVVDSDGEIQN